MRTTPATKWLVSSAASASCAHPLASAPAYVAVPVAHFISSEMVHLIHTV
jgi:hypothetical protein